VPDREVAARLAALRRASVDLERRLRADDFASADAADYWRGQIDSYRNEIDRALEGSPFPQRAIQQVPRPGVDSEGMAWAEVALAELAEIRTRLDAALSRMG
jgi:hypothetical protein